MMNLNRVSAVAGAALLLSACQTTGAKIGMAGAVPQSDPGSAAAYANAQMAAGKLALAQGNYAAAISALRVAAMEPQFAADAHNAIGVAYGQIGRHDLAARYFEQASVENPTEDKYRDNHVRALVANLQGRLEMQSTDLRTAAAPVITAPLEQSKLALRSDATSVVALRDGAIRPLVEVRQSRAAVTRVSPNTVALALAPQQPLPGKQQAVAFAEVKWRERETSGEGGTPFPHGTTPTGPEPRSIPSRSAVRTSSEASGASDKIPRRLAIQTSGRMIANDQPVAIDRLQAPRLAEVFAPVGRGLVQAKGLIPRGPVRSSVAIARAEGTGKLALSDR